MSECYPCESCWCSIGKCYGIGLLLACCGCWACKGFVMEQFDPNCCYCCEQSGLGFHLLCCGCICCHPTWMNLYMRQQFPKQYIYNDPYGQGVAPNPFNTPISPYLPANPSRY